MTEPSTNIPKLLWQPTAQMQKNSHLQQYIDWLSQEKGLVFDHYDALWQWSCRDLPAFWQSQWEYFQVISHAPATTVLKGEHMPDFKWFDGAMLNYAEHIFRQKSDLRPAIIFKNEWTGIREMSWEELERQTAAFAQFLRASGVASGDRVAAYLPNSPHAMIAVLATISIKTV